jgi:hypothetical protein
MRATRALETATALRSRCLACAAIAALLLTATAGCSPAARAGGGQSDPAAPAASSRARPELVHPSQIFGDVPEGP